MNLDYVVSDYIGLIHLVSSVFALIFGTLVLFNLKGTNLHKRTGYLYTTSMTVVLITSFMMYNLYGRFGIFHWLALLSSITLLGGIIPIIFKKPASYVTMHFSFMYWSVFGLYGAFVAEILVRIPKAAISDGTINPVFYNMVGLAVFVMMGIGYFVFKKKKHSWAKLDRNNSNNDDS